MCHMQYIIVSHNGDTCLIPKWQICPNFYCTTAYYSLAIHRYTMLIWSISCLFSIFMYYEYASHAISIKIQLMQTSKTHLFKRTGYKHLMKRERKGCVYTYEENRARQSLCPCSSSAINLLPFRNNVIPTQASFAWASSEDYRFL